MNRSFRAKESVLLDSAERQRQKLRASMMAEKDEELSLFLEMRRREKEQDNNNNLLLNNHPDDFETPLGSKSGTSPVFNISSGGAAPRKTATQDDFLNSEGDKNDYEWLLTPPGTPLFPSLEIESHRTMMSQTSDSKGRSATLTSRLANSSSEPAARNHLTSRQPTSAPGLSSSSGASRRPSSSGGPGSRPSTPTGRSSSLTTNSKPSRPSTPTSRATVSSTTRPSMTSSRSTISAATKPTSINRSTSSSRLTPTASKPTTSTARSAGSTRSTTSTATTTRSAGPSRSTTPLSRSTARSSTPTSRPSLPPPKTISRSATPTRRPISSASAATTTAKPTISQIRPSSPASKPMPTPSKTPAVSRGASPTVRSRPWKPSDMPGFSLETPPNLRTTLPERPLSATRGRPGAPSPRSSSVEPGALTGGRPRRQSCSPSRGRTPMYASGSSVPAVNRGYSKANDNVSPVLMGAKMVERVINMRKLAPPRSDDKSSPHGNLSAKSSSPDSSGFGRTLSKKSLDMAIRHMDIRRTIPGNLRPLMTNIPASSMYSVRSGHTRGRPTNVSDSSPLATSSNASSEISVCNNNGICLEASEKEDDAGSERGCRSPANLQGR